MSEGLGDVGDAVYAQDAECEVADSLNLINGVWAEFLHSFR